MQHTLNTCNLEGIFNNENKAELQEIKLLNH